MMVRIPRVWENYEDCWNCRWASESMVKGDVCGNRDSERYGKALSEDGCELWDGDSPDDD